jgi:hypothetical protein
LWSRKPPPNSVGAEQIIDGSIITSKIADGAVTPSKVSDSLKSQFVLGDDTEVYDTTTNYIEKKVFNFYKDTSIDTLNWKEIEFIAELKTSTAGTTAYVSLFVDNETTPRIELSTTSTTYTILRGTCSISDLTTGLHTFSIRIKISGSGTVYQRHVEILVKR